MMDELTSVSGEGQQRHKQAGICPSSTTATIQAYCAQPCAPSPADATNDKRRIRGAYACMRVQGQRSMWRECGRGRGWEEDGWGTEARGVDARIDAEHDWHLLLRALALLLQVLLQTSATVEGLGELVQYWGVEAASELMRLASGLVVVCILHQLAVEEALLLRWQH